MTFSTGSFVLSLKYESITNLRDDNIIINKMK